ncbi:hypothetical protein [Nonomuraea aridisoli]|uniref:Uncharacterized protein n=1 Tax=Nonomuraea aridisoli TaxID=2070368 RepID=A0A2W2ERQ2_9ACTN|nr:hypothetical protein [Nonomuraea aridisoli]PZG19215.1 hypothetical protein C1J01_12720 [Nonomuraea aridisoli]
MKPLDRDHYHLIQLQVRLLGDHLLDPGDVRPLDMVTALDPDPHLPPITSMAGDEDIDFTQARPCTVRQHRRLGDHGIGIDM